MLLPLLQPTLRRKTRTALSQKLYPTPAGASIKRLLEMLFQLQGFWEMVGGLENSLMPEKGFEEGGGRRIGGEESRRRGAKQQGKGHRQSHARYRPLSLMAPSMEEQPGPPCSAKLQWCAVVWSAVSFAVRAVAAAVAALRAMAAKDAR